MAIKTRNKLSVNFSMASMSDLVFLLLIFFMLTSTLIAPNAIKLLLPSSNSKTMSKQTVTVYINEGFQYFVEERPSAEASLAADLRSVLLSEKEGTVVVRSDKSVPVQYVVNVIDAINQLNEITQSSYKVILATTPKK
ncbi:biopolymer transporter ExbD [Bacteroidales bacterium]